MKIGVPLDMTAERRKRLMQASQKVTELLIEVTEGPLEAQVRYILRAEYTFQLLKKRFIRF